MSPRRNRLRSIPHHCVVSKVLPVDHIGLEPIRQPACKASPLTLSITRMKLQRTPDFRCSRGFRFVVRATTLRGQAPARSAVHTSWSWFPSYHTRKARRPAVGSPPCVGGFPGPPNLSQCAPTAGIEPASPFRDRVNSPSQPANSCPMGIRAGEIFRSPALAPRRRIELRWRGLESRLIPDGKVCGLLRCPCGWWVITLYAVGSGGERVIRSGRPRVDFRHAASIVPDYSTRRETPQHSQSTHWAFWWSWK